MFKQIAIRANVLVLKGNPERLAILDNKPKIAMGTNIPKPIPMLRLLRRKNIFFWINEIEITSKSEIVLLFYYAITASIENMCSPNF